MDADRRRIELGLECVCQKSWHCYIDWARYEVSVVMSDAVTPEHIRNLICELNRINSADKKPVLNPDLKIEGAIEPLVWS